MPSPRRQHQQTFQYQDSVSGLPLRSSSSLDHQRRSHHHPSYRHTHNSSIASSSCSSSSCSSSSQALLGAVLSGVLFHRPSISSSSSSFAASALDQRRSSHRSILLYLVDTTLSHLEASTCSTSCTSCSGALGHFIGRFLYPVIIRQDNRQYYERHVVPLLPFPGRQRR